MKSYQIVSEWHKIKQFLLDEKGQEVVKDNDFVLIDEIKDFEPYIYAVKETGERENLAEFKTFEQAKEYVETLMKGGENE